jgi:hypothetical protein
VPRLFAPAWSVVSSRAYGQRSEGRRLMLNLSSLCESSGHSQRTAFGKPWRRLTICRQRIPRGSNHRHDSYHIG